MAQISKRKNNFEMKLSIMKIVSGVFLVSFLLIISCSETEQVFPDLGMDYYPLQVGNYAVYQVEETTILQSTETEELYELKVTVTDSIINDKGEVTYIMVREKKIAGASVNWENYDTWSVKVINSRVIQNEANVTFVKLIFPPSLNLSWDGNEYNNMPDNGELFYDGEDTDYFISEMDKPISLETGIEADQSLTVIHNDLKDNYTGIDERKEIYARDVGLIYKEVVQIKYCTDIACYGQQKVEQGVILVQSLKEYGKI
jgi:hypothetical protein